MFKKWTPWGLLIGFSLLVHLPGLTSPLLDYQAYRQTQTASMARNYFRHGMKFLNPQLDTEGTPVRAGTEFPIYSYLVALLYKLFGLDEIWGRILSAIFGAWGAIFLYKLVRPRLGETRALWSGLIMSAIPIHVFFTRTVQPEPMALWGLLGFLYYTDRWLNRGGTGVDWLLAALLGATAPLLKLPYIYLVFLLGLSLVWESRRWKGLLSIPFWAAGGLMLGLTWLWYHYAKTAPVGVLPLDSQEHWDNLRPILSWDLWQNHFISRLPELCLTYPGLVLAGIGVWALRRENTLRFWAVWFGITSLYIVLMGKYGVIHRYTALPFAPVNAVLIAAGFVALWERLKNGVWEWVVIVLLVGIPVHAGLRIKHWYEWEYPWVFSARDQLARISKPTDLVVTNTREHPVLLYYLNRYGWSPALEETGLLVLKEYQEKGARFFLTPTREKWAEHPEWAAYLNRMGRLIHADPEYLIYRFD